MKVKVWNVGEGRLGVYYEMKEGFFKGCFWLRELEFRGYREVSILSIESMIR